MESDVGDVDQRIGDAERRRLQHEPALKNWCRDVVQRKALPYSLSHLASNYAAFISSEPTSQGDSGGSGVLIKQLFDAFSEWHGTESAKQISQAATLNNLQMKLAQLDQRIAEQAEKFAAVEANDAAFPQIEALARLLNEAATHVRDDKCPVCHRDYSELGNGSLIEHIRGELVRLQSDVEKLNADLKARQEAAQALKLATTQHDATHREINDLQPLVSRGVERIGVLTELLQTHTLLRPASDEFLNADRDLTALRAQRGQLEKLREQLAADRATVLQDAVRLRANFDRRDQSDVELAEATEALQAGQLSELQESISLYQESCDALDAIQRAWRERRELIHQIDKQRHIQKRLDDAASLIEQQTTRLKRLAKAAGDVKVEVGNEVFSDSLNRLWNDLFERMVKAEPFRLRLKELKNVRGRARIQFEAVSEVQDFEQPAAILSSGNLNTAALSLFLAMHLVEQQGHQVLVLDDPVQNMDDMHIVQLAEVLRTVVRETGRQLVIAVHERPLFDFLALELSPVAAGQSLRTIELSRSPVSFEAAIHSQEQPIVWAPDELTFG